MSKQEEAVEMLKNLSEKDVNNVIAYMNNLSETADNQSELAENKVPENKCFEGNVGFLFESIFG